MKTLPISETQTLPGSLLGSLWTQLRSAWQGVSMQRRQRRLRLSESVSLGEKRLIAVVEFEEQRFLVAATSERISLLQSLGPVRPEEIRSAERA
jgi:flagellar biogenesis protein FliO